MEKILVVDDDLAVRELIQLTLHQAGYEVLSASNGKSAVEIARNEKPNLILLDVRLPLMDGYEVCRQITSDPTTKNIPVIFVTARGQIEEIRLGLSAGAVDYFVKPFSPELLKKRVRELLITYQ
jgi:two-component system alkaline phosphatase synthesis response regulator PhoP